MSAELLRLAERCEKETAGSREFDALIAISAFPAKYTIAKPAIKPGCIGIRCDVDNGRGYISQCDAKAYTSSLDAAMSLVPEGWCWMAGHRDYPKSRAYVNNGELHMSGKNQWFEVVAATPALALTAAALKARALASRDDERGE